MKTIVIGDIHDKTVWKDIIEKEDDFDKVIFLGDYFDTFEEVSTLDQIFNFKEICNFKRDNPNKVILLLGNHDYHYMRGIDEFYSGFNAFAKVDIGEVLFENKDITQIVHVKDKFLFVHAGVGITWAKIKNINIDSDKIEQSINDLFVNKPKEFKFDGIESSGNSITQGPLWIRPQSLIGQMPNDLIQVVGHTKVKELSIDYIEKTNMILCDTFDNIDKQYLVIEDEILTPKFI